MKIVRISSLFLFLFILAGVSLVSCKEETLRVIAQDNTPTSSCSDGILNGDETGIDCGGSCSPCVVAPCTPTTNSITFTGSGASLGTTYNTVTCEVNSSYNTYRIMGSYSGGTLVINLSQGKPTTSKIYNLSTSTILFDQNTANITLNSSNGVTYSAPTGRIYVNVVGTVVTATFCSLNFESYQVSGTYTGSGKLICN